MKVPVVASVVLGLSLIIGGLVFAVLVDLDPQTFFILRVLIALGAGFAAAGILGTLEIENPALDLTVKAGGPIAFTVLVYLVNPPAIVVALLQ